MIRLFRVFVPTSVIALILSETVLIFSCFLISSYAVLDTDPWVFLVYDGGLQKMTLVVLSVMLGLYFEDLYTDFRIRSKVALVQQLCLVIGLVFFSQALLTYVNANLMMSRWIMIWGCGLVLLLLPIWRVLYSGVVLRALGAQRLLFLGTSSVALEIAERLAERPELGLVSVGFVDNDRDRGEELPGGKILGTIPDLRDIVSECKPDRIVVGLKEKRGILP